MPKVQVLHQKYADNSKVAILAKTFGITSYPAAALIGPDGRLIEVRRGAAHVLADRLEELLKELGGTK